MKTCSTDQMVKELRSMASDILSPNSFRNILEDAATEIERSNKALETIKQMAHASTNDHRTVADIFLFLDAYLNGTP